MGKNDLGVDPDEWFKDPVKPPVGIGASTQTDCVTGWPSKPIH